MDGDELSADTHGGARTVRVHVLPAQMNDLVERRAQRGDQHIFMLFGGGVEGFPKTTHAMARFVERTSARRQPGHRCSGVRLEFVVVAPRHEQVLKGRLSQIVQRHGRTVVTLGP